MALIEISHLTKTYGGNDIPALEDVNISLESEKSRKRTWASFIIVLCLFVLSFFYTIINQLFGTEQYSSYYPSVLSVVISLIFTIGCTVGLYFLSYYLLTKKYELE